MEPAGPAGEYIAAQHRFDRRRRRAFVEEILRILGRGAPPLLDFESVRRRLHLSQRLYRGLREVPLERIVGSLNRHNDFTRSFLPQRASDRARWARLDVLTRWGGGLPPVELYQVRGVYFVADGHHRVSIAYAEGARTIEAYVWEFPARVALSPGVDPGDLILSEEHVLFLERTALDRVRPAARVESTRAGGYRALAEHVEVHRYFLGIERGAPVSGDEAVASWYDTVYTPAVEAIRRHRVLEPFPGKTEADLYLWMMDHLYYLRERYGSQVPPDQAAVEVKRGRSGRRPRGVGRRG